MKKRKTIGFIVSGILDPFTESICRGAFRAASLQKDINLVVIPVKYIFRDLTEVDDQYDYQYQALGDFINVQNVDALIIAASCIGCLTSRSNLISYLAKFKNIPVVYLTSDIEGGENVTFDNRSGIKEGIEYLIKNLGLSKIGIMSGPDSNSDAVERLEVYKEVLRENGIEPEDRWISEECELSGHCRQEADRLLDRSPDLEAVFCVNDMVAMTFYEVLKDRGLEPGRDLKVFGFDNIPQAAKMSPSLTSVDADSILLGEYTYEYTVAMMNGHAEKPDKVPTRLVIRDSFGFDAEKTEKQRLRTADILDEGALDLFFDTVFYRYISSEKVDGSGVRKEFKNVMRYLLKLVKQRDVLRQEKKDLYEKLERFLCSGALSFTDSDELVTYFAELYKAAVKHKVDIGQKDVAEKLTDFMLGLYRIVMNAKDNEYRLMEKRQGDMLLSMKTLAKEILSFKYGNDQSYAMLVSNLDRMNIKNAYIYAFDRPIAHFKDEEFVVPDTLYLKARRINGVSEVIPYSSQAVSKGDIFCNELLQDKPLLSVVFPTFCDENIYGCTLLDLTDDIYINGEYLNNEFGVASRMIDLLKDNSIIQQQLEENLMAMKLNNIELDKLSKYDVLTGILNRRGFLNMAEQLITELRKKSEDGVFIFIDMNNLKIINDRFGHEEGDFALKSISSLLSSVVGDEGIVGRIGGDEYAVVYCGAMEIDELSEKIKESFEDFNRNSSKVYNVTVSCGFQSITGASMKLSEIMALADQKLYIAKRSKDNRILKNPA